MIFLVRTHACDPNCFVFWGPGSFTGSSASAERIERTRKAEQGMETSTCCKEARQPQIERRKQRARTALARFVRPM